MYHTFICIGTIRIHLFFVFTFFYGSVFFQRSGIPNGNSVFCFDVECVPEVVFGVWPRNVACNVAQNVARDLAQKVLYINAYVYVVSFV